MGVPAERIDSEVNARLQKSAPNLRLDGFRPGKVPANMIKDRYGKAIMGEILEAAVNESSAQAMQDKNLEKANMILLRPVFRAFGFDVLVKNGSDDDVSCVRGANDGSGLLVHGRE